jgi:hypothetical protein
MMMQVVKFEGLLGEEQLSTSVTRYMRVSGVNDLMSF